MVGGHAELSENTLAHFFGELLRFQKLAKNGISSFGLENL